jgi:hypothetical protein
VHRSSVGTILAGPVALARHITSGVDAAVADGFSCARFGDRVEVLEDATYPPTERTLL